MLNEQNRFTCLVKSKPVKQEVSNTRITDTPLKSKLVLFGWNKLPTFFVTGFEPWSLYLDGKRDYLGK